MSHSFARYRRLSSFLTASASAVLIVHVGAQAPAHTASRTSNAASPTRAAAAATKPTALRCGDLLGFQVLLDRQSISPGEIDGQSGPNFSHALSAFQEARHIATTGQPDCDTWKALRGAETGPLTKTYTVTEADVKGPFEPRIPESLEAQAKLPSLGYRSALEELAERFHVAPALLVKMNRGARIAAGQHLQVPDVKPFDANAKPAPDANTGDVTIHVSREDSSMRATLADGTLVFFAPVSSGSEHDPLPPGNWKVTGVSWHPEFHYNPDLFWDASPADGRATLKPGPNNPVGVVWVAMNLEHYGMHGTPEPGHIGHTESHGCVRLTNWDATRLASLVRPGTLVVFK